MIRSVSILLAAAMAGPWTGAHAQVETGSVAGVVHDSLRGGPLPGAVVVLWGTPHRTSTDDEGRFRIEAVAPGSYQVVFYHARLGRMGLSSGPTSVQVRAGGRASVALATPSMATVQSALCALDGEGDGAAVVGRVRDAGSGVGLPESRVRATWIPTGAKRARSLTLHSDQEGWFRACDLPAGPTIAFEADFLDRASTRREVRLEEGEMLTADLVIARPVPPTALQGKLVDAADGGGVGGAEIWLEGTSARMVSAPDGSFRFSRLTPGEYTLGVRHLAYGERTDPLVVEGSRGVRVLVELDLRPLPLAPIAVSVEGTAVADRAIGGTLITRADIDAVRSRARDLGDVIRSQRTPGIVVRRDVDGLCVGFTQGQARMSGRADCVPAMVYIDDVRTADPRVAASIPLEAIERVILLRPVEAGNLYGLGSASGVVLIYTR